MSNSSAVEVVGSSFTFRLPLLTMRPPKNPLPVRINPKLSLPHTPKNSFTHRRIAR